MKLQRTTSWFFILSVTLLSGIARSEVIRFPDEEFQSETVLPIFERKSVVLNRSVKTKGKFEIGGGFGMNLIEALYNNMNFNISGTYHFTEVHGLNVVGMMITDGLSSTAEALKHGEGLLNGKTFDASRAPHPQQIYLANYQYTAYYGKVSIGKKRIMNLSLYGLAGLGMVNFGDTMKPALDFGFGQKFYVTSNSGLRVDFRFLFLNGPDPTTNSNLSAGGQKLKSSDFKDQLLTQFLMTVGYVFLF